MANIQKFGGFRFIKGCNAEGTTYAVSDVINYITGNTELQNAICFVSTGADTKRPNYIVFNGKAFGDAEALNQYLNELQVSAITDSAENDAKIPQVIAVKNYVATKIGEVTTAISNLDKTETASTNNLEIQIVQENGLLKTITLTEKTLEGTIAGASGDTLNKLVNAGQVKEYVGGEITKVNTTITNLGDAAKKTVLKETIAQSVASGTTGNLTTAGQVKEYVDGEITSAINGLDSTATTTTAHLNVQIVQTDGELASVAVEEKNFGTAANAAVLTGETISGESANLTSEKQVKKYVESEIAKVNNTIGDLDATITASTAHLNVEIVQTDGKLASVAVTESKFGDAANRNALSTDATISGNADSDKLVDAKQVVDYVTTTVNGLDSTGTGTSTKSGIKVDVVQTDGKITGVAVVDSLGTAAKSDVFEGTISGTTNVDGAIPTVLQVKDYVTSSVASLNGAMRFIGKKDSVPTDNSGYTAGDVILVGNKEYVFDGTNWVELGDGSLYVTKATAIAGHEIQTGITKEALMDALGLDKTGLNADVTSTGNTKIAVQVVETKGKITAVNVTDNLGTAASANVLTGTIADATGNSVSNLVTAGQVKAWTFETSQDVQDIKDLLADGTEFVKSVNGITPTSHAVNIGGQHIKVNAGTGNPNYDPTSGVSIVNYKGNVEDAIIGLETAIAETSKLNSNDKSITVNPTDYKGASVNDIAVNKKVLADTDVAAGNAVELRQDGTGALYGVMYYIADEITNIEIPVEQGGGGPV